MTDAARPVTRTIGFLPVDGFALMSYASAIEPLRAANLLSGRKLYDWRHYSVAGAAPRASNGVTTPNDRPVAEAARGDEKLDMLLVCAGARPETFADATVFAWLRRLANRGVVVGGVSGGPVILANAGLMAGRSMTVHWEHASALAEAHPDLALSRALYVIDRDRVTCAGGVAPLDLMHALITAHHGRELASDVSDWFLHTQIRPAGGPQRAGAPERHGVHRREVIAALELMEAHAADPLPRARIAASVGLSIRQLDRHFNARFGKGLAAFYRDLRLERARDLLRQTALSVTEIAYACGFSGGGHLAQLYRAKYGHAPSAERAGGG
jgi:transcriptional regulator GlxA family with amidase domain